MMTWIGLCAGEVWRCLDRNEGEATLKTLFSGIKAPKETVLMAVGWLAREGFILMEGDIPDLRLKLNPRPPAK